MIINFSDDWLDHLGTESSSTHLATIAVINNNYCNPAVNESQNLSIQW